VAGTVQARHWELRHCSTGSTEENDEIYRIQQFRPILPSSLPFCTSITTSYQSSDRLNEQKICQIQWSRSTDQRASVLLDLHLFLPFIQLRPNLVNNFREAGERGVEEYHSCRMARGMFEIILFTEELVEKAKWEKCGTARDASKAIGLPLGSLG